MSSGGGEPPPADSGTPRRSAVVGWRGRLEALQRRAMRAPPAAAGLEVLRAYDRGGGGMLAAALAYFAFFSMVPLLLLFVSLLGVLIEDRGLRDQLVAGLVDQIDPIRDVATEVIDGLASVGRTGTILGVLGLLWGASGFYGALQGAMQRMFPGPGDRDFLRTRVRGIVTVVVILGILLITVVLVFAVPLVTGWLDARCSELDGAGIPLVADVCAIDFVDVSGVLAAVGAIGVAFLVALLVYVAVPTDGPSVRQALPPALIVGVVIGLFTSLFGLVAPLIVRQWLALGIVGSVFISLVWFNLVFQALVMGAALTRIRRDRDRLRVGPPTI